MASKGNVKAQQQRHYAKHKERIKVRQKAYYIANKEKCKALVEKWRADHPNYGKTRCRKNQMSKHYLTKYGLTAEQVEAMRRGQSDGCAICREPFGRGKSRACVDHCHTTGKVRGLLCQMCNFGLGHFRDSADLLERAKVYLLPQIVQETELIPSIAI